MKYFLLAVIASGVVAAPATLSQMSTAPAQEFVKLENAWKDAVIKRDRAALERLYTDEFMSTDQEGMVWNKAEDIDIDTNGVSQLASFKLDDVKARLYGEVAVVTGRNISKGTLNGRPASSETRFTDVFVKRDGRWQCAASQTTPVAKQ
jgi:ketosteroid isomerase-like protein